MRTGDGGTIVIDNGTGKVKAGFAGDDAPRTVFPPRVGRPRGKGMEPRGAEKDTYIGDEAFVKRDILSPPSDDPDVINWDDMEKIWFHTFYNELRIAPEDYNVLLTESPKVTRANRERTVEIMFEKFQVEGFYSSTSAVLSTIASGRTTSLVFDSGHSASYAVPVYELHIIKHAVERSLMAGKNLTKYLQKLLNEKGYSFTTSADIVQVQLIKEMFGDCSGNKTSTGLDQEKESSLKTFELPDGNKVTTCLSYEIEKCCDAVFNPCITGANNILGAQELLQSALMKCDIDLRQDMMSNIVITGGSTMFKSFPERLQTELAPLLGSSNIQVVASGSQKYDSWIGGSIFASMSFFEPTVVTKDDYNEWGPKAALMKCF